MNDLIIPNWHPLLVHFTIALVVTSSVFFVLSKIVAGKADTFALVGRWTLWSAALVTLLTLLAGWQAFNSVAHDDVAHAVMKTHRFWALITAGALFLLALWCWRAKEVSTLIVAGSLVVTGLVGITGYLGAELVYRHGLGVMRLPDTSGVGHSHADGGDHDHDDATAENETHEHTDHDHDAVPPEDEAHAHADHDHGGVAEAAVPVDPAAISDAFLAALQSGDEQAVDKLLTDDVLIIEGGHAQSSKAAYMAGHMKSDMKFVPHMSFEILSCETGQSGDRAWIVTFSRSAGTYNGKDYDNNGREFMLLRREGEDWKIALIDWAEK